MHSQSNYYLAKGNDLEHAVHAIEHAILSESPSLSENTFKIESKKIVEVEGVRHEIDIWVEVDLGKGYRSIFIFECKNWDEKVVGKNEIIIFSEKIHAVQAQKGFFVAKSFTRYAEAQASKDPRVQLLAAKELSVEDIPVPFGLHFVIREDLVPEVQLHCRSLSKEEGLNYQASSAHATLDGQPIDFSEYLNSWIDEVCDERERTFPSGQLPEDVYELEASGERHFEPSELIVNEQDVAEMSLQVKFKARLIRPPIVSHFEVATRGRVLSLAPVQTQEGAWAQVSFNALS